MNGKNGTVTDTVLDDGFRHLDQRQLEDYVAAIDNYARHIGLQKARDYINLIVRSGFILAHMDELSPRETFGNIVDTLHENYQKNIEQERSRLPARAELILTLMQDGLNKLLVQDYTPPEELIEK